jgi:hydroxyethylthiazole kinase-like uncharacterized protein yjeF
VAGADPALVIRLDADYCAGLLPRRDPDGHKSSFGVVVAVVGSLDYAGAAYMTALAAVRGGAGLVTIAVPKSLRAVFAGRLPEAILLGLPEGADGTVDAPASVRAIAQREPDALVIGPGLREAADYAALIEQLLADSSAPAVVDAGAIGMLAAIDRWWTRTRTRCVLTPHAGEFGRLTGTPVGRQDDERAERCAAAAAEFGQVVVLKGARTVICAPDGRLAVSPFANAALATAGAGDVLCGLIGALLAQGAEPFEAACLGVYLHGRAGERLSVRFGDAGLAASDLPLEIALARHELVSGGV